MRGRLRLLLPSSVRDRIIAGFGLLVLILASVVAGSAWLAREHQSTLAAMQSHADTASLLENAQLDLLQATTLLQNYVITGSDTEVQQIRSSLTSATSSLVQARARMLGEARQPDVALLDQIRTQVPQFARTMEQIIKQRQSGDVKGATATLQSMVPLVVKYLGGFTDVVDKERQELSALRSQATETGDLAFWLLFISGVIGAALGLAISILIAGSILRPLSSLESAALAVAGGDLGARAKPIGPRELASLGWALNHMTESLLDVSKQAVTDALTGLSNHRAFHERIRDEVSRAREKGASVGLIMLDLDGFKAVNDSLGHQAGDQILRDLAHALAEVVRRENGFRYGGDEFAVLLPGADRQKATEVAEQLRRTVESQMNGDRRVTLSLGVADFPGAADSAEQLIYGADAAMYWAKSAGKNRVADWQELVNRREDSAAPWYLTNSTVRAPEVVAALVAALAAKDPATSAHAERCSWYAARVAEELGLDERESSIVGLASLLHDIGKIAVPDHILLKPKSLTEEEQAQIQRHPTSALHILGQVRSIAAATPAVLHHHEHYDGSGYPDGLAGDDIPIASRILLVTDAFDAMTVDRPYRKAKVIQAAIQELQRYGSSQFDPMVVEAFLRVLAHHGAKPLGAKPLKRPAVPQPVAVEASGSSQ